MENSRHTSGGSGLSSPSSLGRLAVLLVPNRRDCWIHVDILHESFGKEKRQDRHKGWMVLLFQIGWHRGLYL